MYIFTLNSTKCWVKRRLISNTHYEMVFIYLIGFFTNNHLFTERNSNDYEVATDELLNRREKKINDVADFLAAFNLILLY